MEKGKRVVVIGAGIGGLTAAAVLARAGLEVTVLEAQTYPGGCAATFYHQDYRFDAGATLAGGFYPGGPMDLLARAAGVSSWSGCPAEPAIRVHLPGGLTIDRWGDERRHAARQAAFGNRADPFWRWQEHAAEALWDLALRLPDWPPQSPRQWTRLFDKGLNWLKDDPPGRLYPGLLFDALRPVSAHLLEASDQLRLFVDAQLIISAQATSRSANALYGAAALDLPRRGVVHLTGGMGAIAEKLASSLRRYKGQIVYRQRVTKIEFHRGRPSAVLTQRGEVFPADWVIANTPPENLNTLLQESFTRIEKGPAAEPEDWGAFMIYLGADTAAVPPDQPLHNQFIAARPLGEGNSIFLSISPGWDETRAPVGKRAITISTHTRLQPWWDLFAADRPAYETRKQAYAKQLLTRAEQILPSLREAAELVLPGTPVTFQRFTERQRGWVGGYPQTSLMRHRGPRVSAGLWMVGDSIFPGQSTAAVALGGLRVARSVLNEAMPEINPQHLAPSFDPERSLS